MLKLLSFWQGRVPKFTLHTLKTIRTEVHINYREMLAFSGAQISHGKVHRGKFEDYPSSLLQEKITVSMF